MPRKNTRKATGRVGIFHAYNREKTRAPMFRDAADKRHFKSLFERYLGEPAFDRKRGRNYPNHRGGVKLLALTLKTNHFHAIVNQLEPGAASELFQAIMISYVKYFNAKYGTDGHLFESEVKFRPADGLRDALGLIGYVHDNHPDHCYCEFCSHSLYVGHPSHVPGWIDVAGALDLFGGVAKYLAWMDARHVMRDIAAAAAERKRR